MGAWGLLPILCLYIYRMWNCTHVAVLCGCPLVSCYDIQETVNISRL